MDIIFVDDEPNAHVNFCQDIQTQKCITSVHYFFTANEVLTYAEHNQVDCAFLDIDLGDQINGLNLAKYLKAIHPNIEIAFLTAYDEYAKLSYQLGGRAYLTKPYSLEELEDALHLMERLIKFHQKKLIENNPKEIRVKIRTFRNFDILVDGRVAIFKTVKAKEALAFLIDQMGGTVNGAEIFFALWEMKEYNANTATYVRRVIRALKEELERLGIADILVCGRNCFSVDVEKIECDSYALLNGSKKQATVYNGEYMQQYSWAENTIPLLDRAARRIYNDNIHSLE